MEKDTIYMLFSILRSIFAKWGRACFDNFFVEFDVCNITQGETQVTVPCENKYRKLIDLILIKN